MIDWINALLGATKEIAKAVDLSDEEVRLRMARLTWHQRVIIARRVRQLARAEKLQEFEVTKARAVKVASIKGELVILLSGWTFDGLHK